MVRNFVLYVDRPYFFDKIKNFINVFDCKKDVVLDKVSSEYSSENYILKILFTRKAPDLQKTDLVFK